MSIVTYTVKDLCDFYEILDKNNKYYVKAKYISNNIISNFNLVLHIDDIYMYIESFIPFFENFDDAIWWCNLYLTFNNNLSLYDMQTNNKWILNTPDHPFEKFLISKMNVK